MFTLCVGFLPLSPYYDQEAAMCRDSDNTQQLISSLPSSTVNISIDTSNDIILSSQVDRVNTEDRESNLGNFLTDVMVNTFKNMTNKAILQSKLLNFCKISIGNYS